MTAYTTCPRCGTAQPEAQRFCGECSASLREGVTRPLTADERAMLEDRARLTVPAREDPAQAGPGRKPVRRLRSITRLALVLLLFAGVVFGLSTVIAGQSAMPPGSMLLITKAVATPTAFTLVERGHSTYLGPGVVMTFTQAYVQPNMRTQMCPNSISIFWGLSIENTNAIEETVVGDQASLLMVDSTGRIYSATSQCTVELMASSFAQPLTINPTYPPLDAFISIEVDKLSAAATYLDLHMLISGKRYAFRAPFP